MPEGPLGVNRPLIESRIKLLVFGDPRNPPTADEIANIINETTLGIGTHFVDNIVEQNINTNQIEGMADEGFISMPIIEFTSGTAVSINRWGEELIEFNQAVFEETGANVFMIAD